MDIPAPRAGKSMLLFVDDTTVITTGKDFMETHKNLGDIMEQPGGIFEWAQPYNCEFSIEKFQLLNLTKRTVPKPIAT